MEEAVEQALSGDSGGERPDGWRLSCLLELGSNLPMVWILVPELTLELRLS